MLVVNNIDVSLLTDKYKPSHESQKPTSARELQTTMQQAAKYMDAN